MTSENSKSFLMNFLQSFVASYCGNSSYATLPHIVRDVPLYMQFKLGDKPNTALSKQDQQGCLCTHRSGNKYPRVVVTLQSLGLFKLGTLLKRDVFSPFHKGRQQKQPFYITLNIIAYLLHKE